MRIHTYIPHEFELSAQDRVEATKEQIRIMLKGGEFLKEVNCETWVAQDDPDWRHGSISENLIRKATELDLALFLVKDALNDFKL